MECFCGIPKNILFVTLRIFSLTLILLISVVVNLNPVYPQDLLTSDKSKSLDRPNQREGAGSLGYGTNSFIRAQLLAVNKATIASGFDGRLEKLHAITGKRFEKNDIIATFNCDLQRAGLDAARARSKAADATLDVNSRLAERDSIALLEVAVSKYESEIRKAELKQAEHSVGLCSIRAPFKGSIAEKFVDNHQFVRMGDPMFRLVDNSLLEVEAVVPSTWLRVLKKGSVFELQVDETNKKYLGEIRRINAEVDPISRSIKIIGTLKRGSEVLLPGMSGWITFAEVK